jgi:hypothetical protein
MQLNRDQVIAAIAANQQRYRETGEKIWLDRLVGLSDTLREMK